MRTEKIFGQLTREAYSSSAGRIFPRPEAVLDSNVAQLADSLSKLSSLNTRDLAGFSL